MKCSRKLVINQVDSEYLEEATRMSRPSEYHDAWSKVHKANGILVPGGFGERGTRGMIAAIKCARETKIPFLGICLGMQLAVVEYAQNVCGLSSATSEEFDKEATEKVIIEMLELDHTKLGATQRLGLRATHFQPSSEWSKMRAVYSHGTPPHDAATGAGTHPAINGLKGRTLSLPKDPNPHLTNGNDSIPSNSVVNGVTETANDVQTLSTLPSVLERHRHRFEVNPKLVKRLSDAGLHFVGKDDSGNRMEILELQNHPWFVGVQFHPEYLSRPLRPSKPYLGFVAAACGMLDKVSGSPKSTPS